MNLVEILSLIAGLMTMAAPMMQAAQTIRSGHVEGLSPASYLLLVSLGVFAVLIGVQYGVIMMIVLNGTGWLANIAILYLISRRLLFGLVAVMAVSAGLSMLVAPWFLPTLITTKWAEPVAFIYGLVAAGTFLPQVILTHRTRSVSALSLPNLALFTAGMTIWIVVSVLLGNYSLIFWNSCLLLMIAELLRLKLVLGRRASTEPPPSSQVVTPGPII